MKNFYFILLSLVIVSCVNNSKPTQVQTQIKHLYEGKGYDVIQVDLNKGLAIFTIDVEDNEGTKNVAVDFRKSDGSYYKGHLFNKLGIEYHGTKSLQIKNTDIYVMNIKIDGKWKLSIK